MFIQGVFWGGLSMPILAILFTGGGGVKPTKPRGVIMGSKGVVSWDVGLVLGIQGDGSIIELSGIMKVAMLGFDLAWVKYPTMLCWL